MKKKIMSYSERDKFGNGRGVRIVLDKNAEPKDILEIDNNYRSMGWKPSPGTKRIVETAKVDAK